MGMDLGERIGGLVGGWIGDKKREREEKRAREERMKLVERMDWEPEFASTNTQAYQKTDSPVARAYIESLVLGQNPDLTYSGETNAEFKKAAQQRTQANLYGTTAQLAKKGAEALAKDPYKLTQPSRSVGPRSLDQGGDLGRTRTTDEMAKAYQNAPRTQITKILNERGSANPNKDYYDLVRQYGSENRVLDMLMKGRA